MKLNNNVSGIINISVKVNIGTKLEPGWTNVLACNKVLERTQDAPTAAIAMQNKTEPCPLKPQAGRWHDTLIRMWLCNAVIGYPLTSLKGVPNSFPVYRERVRRSIKLGYNHYLIHVKN